MNEDYKKPKAFFARLTYSLERYGEIVETELPFVVGIMADFNRVSREPRIPLCDRRFVEFDNDNVADFFTALHPCIDIDLKDISGLKSSNNSVSLSFLSFEDIEPKAIRRQARDAFIQAHDKAPSDNEIDNVCKQILLSKNFHEVCGCIRGIRHLIDSQPHGSNLIIKVLDVSKEELSKDQQQSSNSQDSVIHRLVFEYEYGRFDGTPYSFVLANYQFSHNDRDMAIINDMADTGAEAECVFITGASPLLLGLSSWKQLSELEDFESTFTSRDYLKWREFRDDEKSRFMAMVVPASDDSYKKSEQTFGEVFIVGTELISCFTGEGLWSFSGRQPEVGNGKKLTEEKKIQVLSHLGLIAVDPLRKKLLAPLSMICSVQRARHYYDQSAVAVAAVMKSIPYNLTIAMFLRYIKVISRDSIGSFNKTNELSDKVNHWLQSHIQVDNTCGDESDIILKPLVEANVKIEEIIGVPGLHQVLFTVQLGNTGFDNPPLTQHESSVIF
jgi:type VI secretion system protein ImpC